MPEVRKFIKSVGIFLLFTTIMYFAYLFMWADFMPRFLQKNIFYRIGSTGYTFTRLQEVKTTQNVDVLFLGSSHTYRGFDPRIFAKHGMKSFNLGSSFQCPTQTEILLKRYLHTLNPKTIVYEVYYPTLASDGIESSVDIISNDKNDMESLKMAWKLKHIGTANTLLYAYCNELIGATDGFKEKLVKESDAYIPGGYVEKKAEAPKSAVLKQSPWRYDLNPLQVQAFENIIASIKKNNIRLILLQAPITKKLYQSFNKKEEFDKKMRGYGEYYNFNEILNLDDSLHFYDSDHLSQAGVEVFNKKLIELAFKK
ncbi:MAG: hypothetical protein KF862_11250 [Chitinophagaceae bacterium]|nr:hypothetical protein [Chitinophagaceae bacterium]